MNLSCKQNRVKKLENIRRKIEYGIIPPLYIETVGWYHQALLADTPEGHFIIEFTDGSTVDCHNEKMKQFNSNSIIYDAKQYAQENSFVWGVISKDSIIFNDDEHFTLEEIVDIMKYVAKKRKYDLFQWNCQIVAMETTKMINKLAQNQSYSNQNAVASDIEVIFMARICRKWKNDVGIGPKYHYALLLVVRKTFFRSYYIVEFQNNNCASAYQPCLKNSSILYDMMELDKFECDVHTWWVIEKLYLPEEIFSTLQTIKQELMNCGDYHIIYNNCEIVTKKSLSQFNIEIQRRIQIKIKIKNIIRHQRQKPEILLLIVVIDEYCIVDLYNIYTHIMKFQKNYKVDGIRFYMVVLCEEVQLV